MGDDGSTVTQEGLATAFTGHRPYLVGVGYRLTSTLADAEDAVQEAWLRLAGLSQRDRAAIRDLRAWLTTVVARLCLDKLRSAPAQRERYVGPWLPEPLVTPLPGQPGEDPLDAVVRDDGVRMAALVVLDTLGPEQRVAFVLHDAFGVPFAEIAQVLNCTTETARQHASRARRAVADADPPSRVELAEQQDIVGRFLAAVAKGDMGAIVAVLHPDVTVVGDGAGKARTALNVVTGAEKVARFTLGLMRQYGPNSLASGRLVLVNGDLGMINLGTPGDETHRALDRRVTVVA
ncbi:MAG TPA: RNA polymerase sigma factor SigJ, partial [Pseudonocardiaceae bacterium]|nr:RNA polymerase sigma factor SigJ [Pseudonocardiaceae bacterium]